MDRARSIYTHLTMQAVTELAHKLAVNAEHRGMLMVLEFSRLAADLNLL